MRSWIAEVTALIDPDDGQACLSSNQAQKLEADGRVEL